MAKFTGAARRTLKIAEDPAQSILVRDRALLVLATHGVATRLLNVALELLKHPQIADCPGDGVFFVLQLAARKNKPPARETLLSIMRGSEFPAKIKRQALFALSRDMPDAALFEIACNQQLDSGVRADALAAMSPFTLMRRIDWAAPQAQNVGELLGVSTAQLGEWEQIEVAIWLGFAVMHDAHWRGVLQAFVQRCHPDPLNEALMQLSDPLAEIPDGKCQDWRILARSSKALENLRKVLGDTTCSLYDGELLSLRNALLATAGPPAQIREAAWTVWKRVKDETGDYAALAVLCEVLGDVNCVGHSSMFQVLRGYGMNFNWANRIAKTLREMIADPRTPVATRDEAKLLLP